MTAITNDQLEAAHWLVVGTTGSGKTYLARGLFEQLRRADRRVGAVDKVGKLWGLTLGPDGTAAGGLDFIIFGGKRGVVPMTPDQGGQLGRLFVERNIPAIFDLSQWKASDQERWVADFATAVFAANDTALHLLFDEAQSWVPNGGGGEAYEAVRLLAEQGRGNGVNLLLTAPRMAGLDANVRGSIAAMVAMRQTLDIDIKRTAETIGAHLTIDVKAFRAELPTLPTGSGFIWSPTGAGLERATFPANATFDSSRTPRHGDTPPPPIAISSALVKELRAVLAPPAPAKPESQKSGKPETDDRDARIAELEAEVAELRAEIDELDAESDRWVAGIEDIDDLVRRVQEGQSPSQIAKAAERKLHPHDANLHDETADEGPRLPAAVDTPAADGVPHLAPRHFRILESAAWCAAFLKRESAPRAIVAWMTKVSPNGSGFDKDLGYLRSIGMIDYPEVGHVRLTAAGRAQSPVAATPGTRESLRQAIFEKLPPRQERIIEALWHGDPHTRHELASLVGVSAGGSGFDKDLGHLRSLGLVEYPSAGVVQLAPLLAPKKGKS